MTEIKTPDGAPPDWLPIIVWGDFFYRQQIDFTEDDAWQRWYIGGNGTGKTFVLYWNLTAYMLGIHPKQFAKPPIKVRVIVPSFDNVVDVALEKLQESQIIQPKGLEVGPMLPQSQITKGFTKDHRRLLLKNGSSIEWVTSEQGWQFMRGAQFDILGVDEECDERVFDENLRGLRNAKGGGKVIAGLTPPYQAGQGPTWTKEKILEASVNDPDITVINACMADNPAITPQFIKRFSKGKTKKQIDVQVYGKYPNWGDLVHPEFQNRFWDPVTKQGHILPNDTPMPENWEVDWVMAFDWHQSKECAAVFGFVDSDGNVTFFDELDKEVAEGKDIDELAEIFVQIGGDALGGRNYRRWQDPSAKSQYNAVHRGFNAWDAFRKAGILTVAGKNRDAKDVGVPLMNNYFKGNTKDHPRIFIYERCKFLRQYLGNHYWKRGEDGKGKPDPKWSDYPICVRYILQDLGQKKHKNRKRKWGYTSYQTPDERKNIIQLGI